MRRSDREIKDRAQIIEVMKRCDVCRLALNDEGYPYILPLNFGMEEKDGQIILYFHGASEGRKYELMAKDNRASFEMDCSHELVLKEGRDGCSCTMKYESVIGQGRLEPVPEEEKHEALCALMGHYHKEECAFNRAVMPRTRVFRLVVEHMSGKTR
ncbi:MAG: pyridoxamine 5'-phosphate oxidase family protein [Lachnospiraceae bacterium]|nr:pyridoxamine 5'-phosphate oxidase family protein [Lachnospiraceae bacterium]